MLHDLAEAWHLAALLGLLSPAAAAGTDTVAVLLILDAIHQRRLRQAATLTATTAASTAFTYLITH